LSFVKKKKTNENEEDLIYKGVDPYDDVALLHKLRTGKHLNGLPKRQIKRVNNKVDSLKIDNMDKLTYMSKNGEGQEVRWREYPEKENHSLGHFSTESTKSRIEDDYYWKGMEKDIKKYISKCLKCQRPETFEPMEHLANSLRIGKPFEILHMNMVGGLPTRENKRVLVFAMKHLKVVKLFAVKSKEAEEAARCFWMYCFQFGPPKMLISDQGDKCVQPRV